MLSDVDIKTELGKGIVLEPFEENCLTPVGYDLRVGAYGFSWKSRREVAIDKKGQIRIEPNDTVLIETYESVGLSKQFGATIHSIVSIASAHGLAHISTTIDPGWAGKLLIQVHNRSSSVISLRFKEPLCTACFFRMQSEAKKDHGKPTDRVDIRAWLSTVAEEARARRVYQSPRFWLILAALVIVAVGVGTYFVDRDLVVPLVTVLGVASIFLVEIFKPR